MNKRFAIRIIGQVQGVGFRTAVVARARETGIAGFVANLADGSVYVETEAGEAVLARFVEWCRQGPVPAKVASAEIQEIRPVGGSGFNIG